VIDAEPEAVCWVKLFKRENIAAGGLRRGAAQAASDPLPDVRNGRALSKSARGKIGPTGRLVLNVRLNSIAKRLLKKQPTANAVAKVKIKEKGGKKRLLRQLITLVRP
jgi:hypothetical protein